MKEPDWPNCTEEQLWKFVGYHLAVNGIETVLVGGAVVAIYTQGLYQSGDLDLIVLGLFKNKLHPIMKSLGFERKGRHYVHPECSHLFVEFPPGPLGIGDELDIQPSEMAVKGIGLKILSPTDCIKDRLANYIHFKDQEGLSQAVLVARSQCYEQHQVEQWCLREKAESAWLDFLSLVKEVSP